MLQGQHISSHLKSLYSDHPFPQNVDVLRNLLGQLEHLDLTSELSDDPIVQRADGGFGDVYSGSVWIGVRKVPVALKRIKIYLQKDKDFAMALAKEIRVWSRLCHPNVLRLLGYIVEDNGFPALVSNWIEGGTALEYIKTVPNADIMHLTLGIARGLEYLHGEDVVHSDIKSDNVLISSSGEPLICDFGTSRLLSSSQTLGPTSSSGQLRGSIRWLSPELITRGNMHHTKESDVWAFGMTIYELLTKKRPYHHIRFDPQVLFTIAAGNKPHSPNFFNYGTGTVYDQWLWNLCGLCWKDSPEERILMYAVVMFLEKKIRRYASIPAMFFDASLGATSIPPFLSKNKAQKSLEFVGMDTEMSLFLAGSTSPFAADFHNTHTSFSNITSLSQSSPDGSPMNISPAFYKAATDSPMNISPQYAPASTDLLMNNRPSSNLGKFSSTPDDLGDKALRLTQLGDENHLVFVTPGDLHSLPFSN